MGNFRFADRVKETTTTTGVSAYSMGGAVTAFRAFSSIFLTGERLTYVCEDSVDWEVGIGTLTSGTPWTLSRDTITSSSNGGAAVSWGTGTRFIYNAYTSNLLLNFVYPVGSIFVSTVATNPGTYLGGTWAAAGAGRVLIGVGTLGSDTYTAGATGGEARHVLSVAELASHNHGGATGYVSNDHTHGITVDAAGGHSHSIVRGITTGGGFTYVQGRTDWVNSGTSDVNTNAVGNHAHSASSGGISANHYHGVNSNGSNSEHENRQPYLAVYFFQRTA